MILASSALLKQRNQRNSRSLTECGEATEWKKGIELPVKNRPVLHPCGRVTVPRVWSGGFVTTGNSIKKQGTINPALPDMKQIYRICKTASSRAYFERQFSKKSIII